MASFISTGTVPCSNDELQTSVITSRHGSTEALSTLTDMLSHPGDEFFFQISYNIVDFRIICRGQKEGILHVAINESDGIGGRNRDAISQGTIKANKVFIELTTVSGFTSTSSPIINLSLRASNFLLSMTDFIFQVFFVSFLDSFKRSW